MFSDATLSDINVVLLSQYLPVGHVHLLEYEALEGLLFKDGGLPLGIFIKAFDEHGDPG